MQQALSFIKKLRGWGRKESAPLQVQEHPRVSPQALAEAAHFLRVLDSYEALYHREVSENDPNISLDERSKAVKRKLQEEMDHNQGEGAVISARYSVSSPKNLLELAEGQRGIAAFAEVSLDVHGSFSTLKRFDHIHQRLQTIRRLLVQDQAGQTSVLDIYSDPVSLYRDPDQQLTNEREAEVSLTARIMELPDEGLTVLGWIPFNESDLR